MVWHQHEILKGREVAPAPGQRSRPALPGRWACEEQLAAHPAGRTQARKDGGPAPRSAAEKEAGSGTFQPSTAVARRESYEPVGTWWGVGTPRAESAVKQPFPLGGGVQIHRSGQRASLDSRRLLPGPADEWPRGTGHGNGEGSSSVRSSLGTDTRPSGPTRTDGKPHTVVRALQCGWAAAPGPSRGARSCQEPPCCPDGRPRPSDACPAPPVLGARLGRSQQRRRRRPQTRVGRGPGSTGWSAQCGQSPWDPDRAAPR